MRDGWHWYAKKVLLCSKKWKQTAHQKKKRNVCRFHHIYFLRQEENVALSTNLSMQAPSHAPASMNEGRVLRSSVTQDHDHVDHAHQPSKVSHPAVSKL